MTISIENLPKDTKRMNAFVKRRHPDYDKRTHHWRFLLETYLGSREWFGKNIFQFTREGTETYVARIIRAYRFNHTREVVDLVNKYLFKEKPLRSEDVPQTLKRFRKNATLSGLTLDEFERQVGRDSSIFGRCYVVVDNNFEQEGGAPLSLADEKEMDGQLYAYIVHPDDFLDCGYDKGGQFSWVLLRENVRDDSDPFNSTGDIVPHYRLWTRSFWALFSADQKGRTTLVSAQAHDLGVVPVLKADHVESDNKYVVPALIEDIAYLDRAVANYLSNLDQIINDQTFSQLTMPAQGVLQGAPQASDHDPSDPDVEVRRRHLVKLGTSQILLYDGEHGGKPEYISPDPRQAGVIVDMIHKIINEIYHTVGLSGERTKSDNSLGIDNSSGVAKAFDFERVSALLSAKSAAMQSLSNRLEALVRIYAGEEITIADHGDDTVLYPASFDVRNLTQDLTIANEMAMLQVPMEIRRDQMKNVVDKLWPMNKSAEQKKLYSAIDNWDDNLNNSLTADLGKGVNHASASDQTPAPPSEEPGQGAVGGQDASANISK